MFCTVWRFRLAAIEKKPWSTSWGIVVLWKISGVMHDDDDRARDTVQ